MLGNSTSEGSKIGIGEEPNDRYVAQYGDSHRSVDVDYLVTNSEYLILSSLMPARHKSLILACGTAGSALNLLPDAERIVGVDLSQKMLDEAVRLAADMQVNFTPIQADIAKYLPPAGESYDLIDIGLMGAYIPFQPRVAERLLPSLANGGLLLLRVLVIPPAWSARSRLQRLKYSAYACAIDLLYILFPHRRFFLSATSGMVQREVRLLQKRFRLKHLCTLCRQVHTEDVFNHYVVLQKPVD